jgi:ubiquinone/menaquinone biosynthesis C-methylase UbiE
VRDQLVELKRRYEAFATSGDEKTTACDYNLRDLEIAYGLEFIRDGDTILDVGCGPGVALEQYATKRRVTAFGIDYAENMIEFARKRVAQTIPNTKINLRRASVEELPFASGSFDVVTSHRCLMALLEWDRQQKALLDIHRVLKPGGIYVMLEGTFDGLERLNFYRRKFHLTEIEASGQDRLFTLKFHEKQLAEFCAPHFELLRTQRFGMYYFLTRIVQPLLVAPEQPRYNHPLNEVAKAIATIVPDFESIGHLVGFAWRKRVPLSAGTEGSAEQ